MHSSIEEKAFIESSLVPKSNSEAGVKTSPISESKVGGSKYTIIEGRASIESLLKTKVTSEAVVEATCTPES